MSLRKGTLANFFANSPLAGSDLKIERLRGGMRKIDFESSEAGGADDERGMGDSRSPPHNDSG
jgi:hypothetical protein